MPSTRSITELQSFLSEVQEKIKANGCQPTELTRPPSSLKAREHLRGLDIDFGLI